MRYLNMKIMNREITCYTLKFEVLLLWGLRDKGIWKYKYGFIEFSLSLF